MNDRTPGEQPIEVIEVTGNRRKDDAGEAAMFAATAKALGEKVPALLRMQGALLQGIVSSQMREAKRLAEEDKDDPEALAAMLRAKRLGAVGAQLVKVGTGLVSAVDSQADGDVLHGFVMQANGTPAVGHIVEARDLRDKVLEGRTDAQGHFRIDLCGCGEPRKQRGPRPNRPVEEAAEKVAHLDYVEPDGRKLSEITVSDPSGKCLMRDPAPPAAGEEGPIFRFYPLPPVSPSASGSKAREPSGKK